MKKRILSFFTITFVLSTMVRAQVVTIPDPNFLNALVNHSPTIDLNNDGQIQTIEAQNFYGIMNVANSGITDMTGLEAFVNILGLFCENNSIANLDVTNNPSLIYLVCNNNNIDSLDVTQNSNLVVLKISDNNIPLIDLTSNPILDRLECSRNGMLALDITQNTQLKTLIAVGNSLTALNVSNNLQLNTAIINSNDIGSIDISANTQLVSFYCLGNQLSSLDVSNNTMLTTLVCSDNFITQLNTQNNTSLRLLSFDRNPISMIDLSLNSQLIALYCANTDLTYIDLRNGNNTTIPDANLDLSQNPQLTCVDVDDSTWSANNWVTNLDPQTQFNTNCWCFTGALSASMNNNVSITCLDSGFVDMQISGGNYPLTYNWSLSESFDSNFARFTQPGVYDFVVIDSAGCADSVTFVVDGPDANASFDYGVNLTSPGFISGNQASIYLSAFNDECQSSGATLQLVLSTQVGYDGASIAPDMISGDTLMWMIPPGTYANGYMAPEVWVTPDTTLMNGDIICFDAIITPIGGDADTTNNRRRYCFEIVNTAETSLSVFPAGICLENYVYKDKPLVYTLDFYNTTGTTVQEVVLYDTLSSAIEISSFRITRKSDIGTVEIIQDSIVKATFRNVSLVDTSVSSTSSRFFFTYKVWPKSGIPDGVSVENQIGVWLDGTYAFTTNPTFNTLVSMLPQTQDTTISVFGCDSVVAGSQVFDLDGTYNIYFNSSQGCDSLVEMNVSIGTHSFAQDSVSACAEYNWLGNLYTASGTYVDTIPNAVGCDSVITLKIDIRDTLSEAISISECDSAIVLGTTYYASTFIIDTLVAVNGCDSILSVDLVIRQSADSSLDTTIIEGDTIMIGNMFVADSGLYFDTLMAVSGCDSIVTHQVFVMPDTTIGVAGSYALNPRVVPNPFTNEFVIYTDHPSLSVTLMDLSGKEHPVDIHSHKERYKIVPVHTLSPGVYILKLSDAKTGETLTYQRLVRQ